MCKKFLNLFRGRKSPIERKTYFDICGSSLICAVRDEQGNVIVTQDVSKDFVAIGVKDNEVIFTNAKEIEFLPTSSELKLGGTMSLSLLGVKEDGTPYVKTLQINLEKDNKQHE